LYFKKGLSACIYNLKVQIEPISFRDLIVKYFKKQNYLKVLAYATCVIQHMIDLGCRWHHIVIGHSQAITDADKSNFFTICIQDCEIVKKLLEFVESLLLTML